MLRAPPLGSRPKPGRTVHLHIDKAGRQDAASAVQLLISHAPLLKKQLLWVQDAAPAHPQILPEGRAVGTLVTTRPWNQALVLSRYRLLFAPTILLGPQPHTQNSPALHIPGFPHPTQPCRSYGLGPTLVPSLNPTLLHQAETRTMQPRPEQRAAAQDAAVGELAHQGPRRRLPATHRESRRPQQALGANRQCPEHP